MTMFEELCTKLNVPQGSKYETAVRNMVNNLIFDKNIEYTDDEIIDIVTHDFKKLFPYLF